MSDWILGFIQFFKMFVALFYIGHLMGCFFFFVGTDSMSSKEGSWIEYEGIEDEGMDVKYTTSLYWAITTMATIGYGDIRPVSDNEKIYCIVIMILSCGIFAYIVGNVSAIILSKNTIITEFK